MGAKAPVILKSRITRNKCDYCSRILPSLTSLRAHQLQVHPNRLKERETRIASRSKPLKKKQPPVVSKKILKKPTEDAEKQILSPPKKVRILDDKMLKSPEKINLSLLENQECTIPLDIAEKITSETNEEVKKSISYGNTMEVRKIVFECPKCDRSPYNTYFSALRHIQKFHCEDKDGNPVEPDDSNIIKPIRIEPCSLCFTKVKGTEIHNCTVDVKQATKELTCLGCDLTFSTVKFFDLHLSGKHQDGFDGMFFSDIKEANEWQDEMENITKTTYILANTYNDKSTYRCSYTIDSQTSSTINVCPSSIVVQEFPKGTQVHFYKQHGGHSPRYYEVTDKYKRYLITSIVDKPDTKINRSDLYAQFKKLMEKIISEAMNVNVKDLRRLSDKALELAAILKIDDGELRKVNGKVKYGSSDDSDSPAKRTRRKSMLIERNVSPPVKSGTNFSLADERHTDKLLKELESDVKRTPVKPNLDQSPSFNDSYKEFVGTLSWPKLKSDKCKPNLLKKKVVKTKIGQFKPSPEKSDTDSPRLSKAKVKDIKYEVKERENDCNILILKI